LTHTRDKVSQPACYRKARVRLSIGYRVPSGAASPVSRAESPGRRRRRRRKDGWTPRFPLPC